MSFRYSFSRRRILAGFGSATLSFAGCVGNSSNETTGSSDVSRTSDTESTTSTATTTTTETCPDGGKTTYPFGEWGSAVINGTTRWRFTVTNVESLSSFTIEDTGKTYEMPENKQLVITTTKVDNTSSSLDSWEHGYLFVVLLPDGSVVKPDSAFKHPEFSDWIQIRTLEELSNVEQYRAEGYAVYPDETGTMQWLTVLPRDIPTDSLRIGFNPDEPDSSSYPLRWVPVSEC